MNLIDTYTLTNIKGLGDKSIIKILNYCQQNNISTLCDINANKMNTILSKSYLSKLEDALMNNINILLSNSICEIEKFEKDDIVAITILDSRYPKSLKQSDNPPAILYCKGNIKLLNRQCVAVVGTREMTSTGEQITKKTTEFLVNGGFTIVSGLAIGIDTIAHIECLNNSGDTIAVLPSISNIQPSSNKSLANNILNNNGLLLSEQKPTTKYHSSHLVKRDRIQSGLSVSVFVIETKINGGSMYAVNDAIKHNKTVYCPDISSFDNEYKLNKQTQGIQMLCADNLAQCYTSKDYGNILRSLKLIVKKDSLQISLFD